MAQLSPAQIASHLRAAGVPEDKLPLMTAIGLAESGGRATAHNPNAATGDNSYGIFQVNMLGGMGPERRRQFGIARNEDLFDPATNARAAKQILDSQGLGAWSVFKSGRYKDFLGQAQQGVAGAGVASTAAPAATVGTPSGSGSGIDVSKLFGSSTPGSEEAGLNRMAAAGIAALAGLPQLSEPTRKAASNEFLQAAGGSVGGDPFLDALGKMLSGGETPLTATTSGSPAPTAPVTSSGGRIKAGRVAHPSEDIFPTTGAHLDVRVLKDGEYVNPMFARSVLQKLQVGNKPLFTQQGEQWTPSHPVTSGFGQRDAPTAGASTFHKGVDFGVPAGTELEWTGGGRFTAQKGYGLIETPDGYQIKLLHTVPG